MSAMSQGQGMVSILVVGLMCWWWHLLQNQTIAATHQPQMFICSERVIFFLRYCWFVARPALLQIPKTTRIRTEVCQTNVVRHVCVKQRLPLIGWAHIR